MSDRTPLHIRPAEIEDLPGVLALYAQPDIDYGDVLLINEATRLHAKFASYPDYTLYVAERAGETIGSFALLIMDNLGHLGAPSAIVEDVVVDPARHGQGDRPADDALCDGKMPREGLLQAGAVLERQTRTRARLL